MNKRRALFLFWWIVVAWYLWLACPFGAHGADIRYDVGLLVTTPLKISKLTDLKDWIMPMDYEHYEMTNSPIIRPTRKNVLELREFVPIMQETRVILNHVQPINLQWIPTVRMMKASNLDQSLHLVIMISPEMRSIFLYHVRKEEQEGLLQRLKSKTVEQILTELDGKKTHMGVKARGFN